ncbi:GIY-YIG nuclease family protein, partial [Patescibacteria group bacterium]|nr:GIY-YIG nuclease family protein [Patescibacteria group bacterium]
MKYCTYVLKSSKNNYIYIGSTQDLANRINLHNNGRVKSTKAYGPWIILEYKEFKSRSEAVICERFLKTHQQKDILKIKH